LNTRTYVRTARAASGTFRLRAAAMQRTCSTGAVARRWEQAETEVTQMSTSFFFFFFYFFYLFISFIYFF
jgi:hypothetical protein